MPMKISRRDFVSTAGCAVVTSLCALPSFGFAASDSNAKAKAGCTLLDLKSNCALPESFEGMQAALGDTHRCVTENEFASSNFASHQVESHEFEHGNLLTSDVAPVIVAGAGAVRSETFGVVTRMLEKGALVIWESGAAFLEPREFAEQQALAREYFGISVGRPLDVWSQTACQRTAGDGALQAYGANRNARKMRAIGHERVPYVEYRWPREAHVRDFSRVIPVSAATGRAVAHWGENPVAWSKRVGAGVLAFLGSPIGPGLRAGDSEANSLLRSMIAS